MEIVTPSDLIKFGYVEDCIVKGLPTGLYADGSSYRNEPILAVTLEDILICQAIASGCSHSDKATREFLERMKERFGQYYFKEIIVHELYVDNKQIAIASSIIDSFIRSKKEIELHGRYQGGMVEADFIKVGVYGFNFFRGS